MKRALLLGAGALAIYAATSAHAVLGGDNGEFATLYAEGGVAHPPGYPLYTLYLRALSWLPAQNPAHGAALATALLGAAALVVFACAAQAWGASQPASLAAAALFGFAPLPWILHTHAEVFALNDLLAATLLLLSADTALAPRRRLLALGLIAGLGLSHHHSIVLLAPLGLYACARSLQKSATPWRDAALAIGALLGGLTPYLYLWWTSQHPGGRAIAGEAATLHGLWRHFTRAEYGSTQLAASGGPLAPWTQLATFAAHATRDLLVVGMGAAIVGLARVRRPAQIALALSLLLAGPLFVTRFNMQPDGLELRIIERFYALPELLLCFFAAFGIDAMIARAGRLTRAAWLGVALCIAGQIVVAYPEVREHHRPTVELFLRNTLASLPERAVVLGLGDHHYHGLLYLQHALSLRRDVTYLDVHLLATRWGRRQAEAALGAGVGHDALDVATQVFADKRPLFLVDAISPAFVRALPNYPLGTTIAVLPPGTPLPSVGQIERDNARLFERFELEDRAVATPDSWAAAVEEDYARPWVALGAAYRALGDAPAAARCRAIALGFAPWVETQPMRR